MVNIDLENVVGTTKHDELVNCLSCGQVMYLTTGSVSYLSLPGTTLSNIVIRVCSGCGEEEFIIPAITTLEKYIANKLMLEEGNLSEDEEIYLSKVAKYSEVVLEGKQDEA